MVRREQFEDLARSAIGDDAFDSAFAEGSDLQLEVAGLVADGLANKEIAASPVISLRTAEAHVEHILSKLGFTSRTQIAAWVSEQRWAG